MQVVCCWTSPLLSQTGTLKPYFAAFFWYIFQEKAWDGLSIWAMNISVGLSPGRGRAADPPRWALRHWPRRRPARTTPTRSYTRPRRGRGPPGPPLRVRDAWNLSPVLLRGVAIEARSVHMTGAPQGTCLFPMARLLLCLDGTGTRPEQRPVGGCRRGRDQANPRRRCGPRRTPMRRHCVDETDLPCLQPMRNERAFRASSPAIRESAAIGRRAPTGERPPAAGRRRPAGRERRAQGASLSEATSMRSTR